MDNRRTERGRGLMDGRKKAACPGGGGEASDINSRATFITAPQPVALTLFSSRDPLSKSFKLDERGAITKQAAAQMTRGTAQRIEMDFDGFGDFLQKLTSKQAIGFGLHDIDAFGQRVRIATASKANPPGSISRTRDYFRYQQGPGVLMLDHDRNPYVRQVTPDELCAILAELVPGFDQAARVVRGSISSGVHRIGEQPKESSSFHIYVAVHDASDIPRFGATLFKRLWLAGHGFIALSKSGAMLERSLIDGAVFSPERLDFQGWPIVGDGLAFESPRPVYEEGAYLDSHLLPDLDESENAEYERLVAEAKRAMAEQSEIVRNTWIDAKVSDLVKSGIPELQARKQLQSLAVGKAQTLPDEYVLHFESEGTATVREVLANPKRFDGQALADPIEGPEYGATTAKLFANTQSSKPCIHSFAHGMETIYFLTRDKSNGANETPDSIDAPLFEDEESYISSLMADADSRYGGIATHDDDGRKKSQATLLIEISAKWDYFHDADQNAYAIVRREGHREIHSISSAAFRRLLSGAFFETTGKGCNRNSIGDALSTIEAKAVHKCRCEPVFLRVARHAEKLYIDTCDDRWRVVEVTSEGWRILDESPIFFVRKKSMTALPEPTRGGTIAELRRFVNCSDDDFALVVGWMLGALRGRGPYPCLVLQGEQGTGKTMLATVLRVLTDPSTVAVRPPMREVRDLLVSASNSHIVSLDNLSGLTPEFSDALCRLATGGGMDARKLYTDDEQCLIEIQRPCIVNGIDELAARPDLAERSIILHLPTIDPDKRECETSFWRDFNEAKPRIFGALLDALLCALRNEQETRDAIKFKPRMADFAVWAEAAASSLGWQSGSFLTRFNEMQGASVLDGIEASPIGSAIMDLVENEFDITMRSGKLLNRITDDAGTKAKHIAWPKTEKALWNQLSRMAPSFRKIGIEIEKLHKRDGRHYRIRKSCNVRAEASHASQTNRINELSVKHYENNASHHAINASHHGAKLHTSTQSFTQASHDFSSENKEVDEFSGKCEACEALPHNLHDSHGDDVEIF